MPRLHSMTTLARVVFLLLACAVGVCAQRSVRATVAPCADRDWRLVFSSESRSLLAKEFDFYGGFSSCEVAHIPFLPAARVLRLHTPVQVDYVYTAALLQAVPDGPLKTLSSGRGPMMQPAQPDTPESIAALNFILDGVTVRATPAVIRIIADLYFFMLDTKPGVPFSPGPIATHRQPLSAQSGKTSVSMGQQTAKVTYDNAPWELNFEIANDRIQLASVQSKANASTSPH